ncbi:MAG: hypothetical protein ACI9TO_000955 [Rickettsiales bacterium]|jgi:hypothetical protein
MLSLLNNAKICRFRNVFVNEERIFSQIKIISKVKHCYKVINFFINNLKIFPAKPAILCLSLCFLLSVSSCQDKSQDANRNFLRQYESEVQAINIQRETIVSPNQEQRSNSKIQKDPVQAFGIDNVETAKTAFIDTSQIFMPKPPEEFLPDMQTLLQGKTVELPEEMFHVSYNPDNFPYSYGRDILSFDDIKIPTHDSFGVPTDLGDKNYRLIDRVALQRDFDFAQKLTSSEDRMISEKLIKQEEQAQRRKYFEKRKEDESKEEEIIGEEIKEEEIIGEEIKEEEIIEGKIKETKKEVKKIDENLDQVSLAKKIPAPEASNDN